MLVLNTDFISYTPTVQLTVEVYILTAETRLDVEAKISNAFSIYTSADLHFSVDTNPFSALTLTDA